jgi:DNA-binding NarL/FixJ family response regulator
VHCNDLASAESLRLALTSAGFEVVDAPTTTDVVAHITDHPVDAVILDLDGGDGSAYLACKLLRERCGEGLPIMLLSGERAASADRVVGLLLGADDYVVKPFDSSEVITRMQRLVTRSEHWGPRAAPADRDGRIDDFDLTERERQVMRKLLLGRTQAEIASELVISSNTVATHIQRILLKLGVHNRAQAVAKVARAGWLDRELDEAPEARPGAGGDDDAGRSDGGALYRLR